ncbi:histidine kinase (plasmid) [Fulvitalea axinellae]|uniref:Histidine kinase n=2 Tax=Fulvitalea axinellae TaxID=1182444 RepID=A0AAU9CY88_9BACT|nr:histidine kinase [Fulvitalea axinellae]
MTFSVKSILPESLQQEVKRILNIRWVQHVGFWIWIIMFSFIVSNSFQQEDRPFWDQLRKSFSMTVIGMPASYFNLYILVPRYLNQKRYFIYILSALLSILAISAFSYFIFFECGWGWFEETMFRRKLAEKGMSKIILSMFYRNLNICLMTAAVHFARRNIKAKEKALQLEEVKKEKYQVELNALKAQINPHFLFNSLNSVYALTLEGSREAPDTVLKISNLISYILYRCEDDKVPVQKEVAFLKDYVSLEKIRIDPAVDIQLDIQKIIAPYNIAPLLLLPLVENAFKHGIIDQSEKEFVHIRLEEKGRKFFFEVTNSFQEIKQHNTEKGGIGVANVKKRLKLIYPNKHSLNISKENEVFKVQLEIDLE